MAEVCDGKLNADVEGITLVQGQTADKGFMTVSDQGVSTYNVYRRHVPYAHVTTFTITASRDDEVDAVSNTDGI